MSSNDFDGPYYRPDGGQGAGDQGAGANGAGGQGAGRAGGAGGDGWGAAGDARYRAPEGLGDDGVWRDSSIDADYETRTHRAIRPGGNGPHGDPSYSYFSDGNGWRNSGNPGGPGARPGQAPDATSLNATRAVFGAGPDRKSVV